VDFEQEVIRLVNIKRADGATCTGTYYPPVPTLKLDTTLRQAARDHSRDMATNNFFSHTGSDGRSSNQRVIDAGFTTYPIGENIAAGQPTPELVVKVWMTSPGHCSNIMKKGYGATGVGYCSLTSSYTHYWTQTFGGLPSESDNPKVEPELPESDLPEIWPELPEPKPEETEDPETKPELNPIPIPETSVKCGCQSQGDCPLGDEKSGFFKWMWSKKDS